MLRKCEELVESDSNKLKSSEIESSAEHQINAENSSCMIIWKMLMVFRD